MPRLGSWVRIPSPAPNKIKRLGCLSRVPLTRRGSQGVVGIKGTAGKRRLGANTPADSLISGSKGSSPCALTRIIQYNQLFNAEWLRRSMARRVSFCLIHTELTRQACLELRSMVFARLNARKRAAVPGGGRDTQTLRGPSIRGRGLVSDSLFNENHSIRYGCSSTVLGNGLS